MLVYKKLHARCGLFRSGAVQLPSAPPRPETAPGLRSAQAQPSILGVSSTRRTPLYGDRAHGGRR